MPRRQNSDHPDQMSLPLDLSSEQTGLSSQESTAQEQKPVRVDGATIQRRLTQEIKGRNPELHTYRIVNSAIHEEMLDESVEETYSREGAKSGDRSRLPQETQVKLIAGDIGATQEIIQTDAQGHQQIVGAARSGAKAMRQRFFLNEES